MISVVTSSTGTFSSTASPSTGAISGLTASAGDVIVMFIVANSAAAAVNPTVSGWVNALGGTNIAAGASYSYHCWYHVITPAEAAAGTTSWTLSGLFTASRSGRFVLGVLRGCDIVLSPVDVVATGVGPASTSHVGPSVTPRLANELFIGFVGTGVSGETYTAPDPPWSVQVTGNSGQSAALVLRSVLSSAGVASGAQIVTASTAAEYGAIMVAVRGAQDSGFFGFF